MYIPPGSEVQGSYTKRKRKGGEGIGYLFSSLGGGRRGIGGTGILRLSGRGEKRPQEGWERTRISFCAGELAPR